MATGKRKTGEDLGLASGTAESALIYTDNVIFHAERGHGFAAEKANHLIDQYRGKDAKLVGGDNAKNGADRLVDGVQIQTKYCRSGASCVKECFDTAGNFRYVNIDGTPMQIEVPSDKFDDAVKAMQEKIRKGQIKGATDPNSASEIIRKGNFTYEQARRIAVPGSIEGLTYDAANGIKLAGTAAGLSAAVTFALAIWNGEDFEAALDDACYSGLKVGGIAWVSSLISAQVGRTGLEQGLRTTTDWVVQQFGAKTASWIATGLRSGNALYGSAAQNHVSKLLRGNLVAAAIATLVLSTADLFRLFDGKISGAQIFKNVANTAAGVAGGMGGLEAGGAAGFALGGPPGALIGSILGGLFGGMAAQGVSKVVLDGFIEDDAKSMSFILETVFAAEAQRHLLGRVEAEAVLDGLKGLDLPARLRDMHAAADREKYAGGLIAPLVSAVIGKRRMIVLPSDRQILNGVVKLVERMTETATAVTVAADLPAPENAWPFPLNLKATADPELNAHVSVAAHVLTAPPESLRKKPAKKIADGVARLQPSAALAAVIGKAAVDRSGAVKLMWAYISANDLQDKINPRAINSDKKLLKLFGKPQVSMFELVLILDKNLGK